MSASESRTTSPSALTSPTEPSKPLTIVPAPLESGEGDWRAGLPVLSVDGLVLREPQLADATMLFEQLATDDVSRFMSRPPSRPAGFERFIAWLHDQRRLGRCLCYGIVPAGETSAVGLIQVRQLEPNFGAAEWGFALGRSYWGTGLFRSAAVAVVDFVFRHAGAYRLEARASTENGRGNGALRKLGATAEGVLRKSLVGAARPMDQLLWSMHGEDWLRNHPVPSYSVDPPAHLDELPAPPGVVSALESATWRHALPTFITDLCTLRDLRLSDAPELLRQMNHPDVERFIPPSPTTIEGFEQFIAWALRQREAGRYACFAVVPRGANDAVGIFQVRQLDPSFLTAEWGFVIGKEYWGTGFFPAAAVPVLDFAFETIGVLRLEARAATGNVRGNGALRKVGATLEGQLRRSFLLGGVYHDDALWALLPDDWRQHREQLRRLARPAVRRLGS
jgi:RimJ/RimL family protein N-acetyltransferase